MEQVSLTYTTIKQILWQKRYFRYFLILWFLTITTFLWLINVNLLIYILSQPVLTVFGKLQFIASTYRSFFIFTNPIALSRFVFSLLLAINLTLLLFAWFATRQRKGMISSNSGSLAAMVGSHCISCGTSLVAPLITVLSGSGAYFSAERASSTVLLATGANILGIILVTWSIKGIAARIREGSLL